MSSRRYSYGDSTSGISSRSSNLGSSRYDSSPSRSYSSTYDSGLRSYSSNRTLSELNNYGTSSSISRYGSSSGVYESSRPPRPSSTTYERPSSTSYERPSSTSLDRYSSSINVGSGVGSGSYRSSLEYSAPTRSYSYASGLSGSSYSSPYSAGSSTYRTGSSYSGYSSGLSSSRDYGSSKGLSKRDDYGSYSSSRGLYGSLSEAHSDITLKSTYTPRRYGTYETPKETKPVYSGVLKSERELEKASTPEIEQAFSSKPLEVPNRKINDNLTLQLPDTTTNDEFNAFYDRYVTHSPVLAMEKEDETALIGSRRESGSLIGDSAYSSKTGQESETLSASDKNEELEALEQDEETEQEESDTICCATNGEYKKVEESGITKPGSTEKETTSTATEAVNIESNKNEEEVDEIEFSAESADEEPDDTKNKIEEPINNDMEKSSHGLWNDFGYNADDQVVTENMTESKVENSMEPNEEGDAVRLEVFKRSPWEDFNSSFAEDEAEEENEENDNNKSSGIPARNPWDDFASSFADEDGGEEAEEEDWENDVIQRNIARRKLQQSHAIAESNSSLWSDFDVPYEPNAEEENDEDVGETGDQEIKVQSLNTEQYKPALWEQFCSFDGGTDNEAEDDDENEGGSAPWKQFVVKPAGRKYSIQIEAETDSESEDVSDRSPKSHSHHKSKKSSTMLLAPPGKSAMIADTSGASDIESEFDFSTNCVSATFPFLPKEQKQEERGRVEAHLALPAPVFNIHMSYDSDYPDEESVASISDYEDLSDGSDDGEEEDEVEVDVDDEEYEDEIKQDVKVTMRKDSQIVPHIMVTSSDVSEMMTGSDYQERLESPNDAAYDADISRPTSMYSSGDTFMFKSAEDDLCLKLVLDSNKKKESDKDLDTNTTFITIKRTPKVDFKELSPGRSITPDSEGVENQQSDGEFDQSVYHDAPEPKAGKHKPHSDEQESEVFVDDFSDDDNDPISHKSDLFIDAPTTADMLESKDEIELASEINECHPKQYDMAVEIAPEEEVTLVAKKFQQAYKEAKEIEKQKLLTAKVETEIMPAEKADRLISNTKKPDSTSAIARTVKAISDKAKLQQVETFAAPNLALTTVEANELPEVTRIAAVAKDHTVTEKVTDVKVVPTLAKMQTEKVNLDRADAYQAKKPTETWAKKSVQLELKQEKIVVKTPHVQVSDKEPLVKAKEVAPGNKSISTKTDTIPTKQEALKVEIPNKEITPQVSPVSKLEDSSSKSKLRTTGIDKMSERFESKGKANDFDFKQKYGAQKTAIDEKPSKPTDGKQLSPKYPKAFAQQEAPSGPSFEEQMEELRRKMKAGSSQISQQMKDLSKGISDVTTSTKLVAEQETHKSVLNDASNLRDQVSKKVDKWKVDSEAETAKREQELKEMAEKQAQKAKAVSAVKLASSPSPTPVSKSETKNMSISEIQRQQEKELKEIAEKKSAEPTPVKPQTGLHGRPPSKLSSPFMQKVQAEIQEKSKKDSLESLLMSKQANTMKPLQPLISTKLPDTKASSASPLSRTSKTAVDETKSCSLSPSIPQQKMPVTKQLTDLTQRLGPDGESDHEAKGPSKFAATNAKPSAMIKPFNVGDKAVPSPTAFPGVVSKLKEEAPKQTAEITKRPLTKADIVEQGVASQAKVKGALQQAELTPSKVHSADEAKFVGLKPKLDQDKAAEIKKQVPQTTKPAKKSVKCHKCKHRRNKFISKIQDIDDLLSNKENKNKTFDQVELFYQNCGRDKRTVDLEKTKGIVNSKRCSKTHIWDVKDIDELYDDKDLRSLMGMLSPTSKVTFDFFKDVPKGRKPGDGDIQRKVDECNVQIYRSYENGQADFGSYLDHDISLAEQPDELAVLKDGRRTSLVLRTQLSVRVHTIIEKLLNSTGRDLRRALFSLKQIFQDDKDLVHEFVQSDGLSCLIKVGAEADQNYQNYILRALGQVMLYVDGMNGVIAHNETIQWLYSLLSSQFRLVVKTALKLLLVFVEYTESNSLLLLAAVYIVDKERDASPWSYLMYILNDKDNADLELLVYAMTLINKSLNGIPDQDTYYDVVDALEEQGMEETLKRMFKMNHKELTEQCRLYEGMLNSEDGDGDETGNAAMNIAKMRQTPRTRTGSGDRKSHRKQYGSDEKRKLDSSNGVVSPDSAHKSKPQFERIVPKQETVKYGKDKGDEVNNNVTSSRPSYLKRGQDSTPGLTANKRLTMDLLYKKGSVDIDDLDNNETLVEECPSKQDDQNKPKCPPPKLPDLSYDDGDTPTSPPPFQKTAPVGAVHSLADKLTPNASQQKAAVSAEQEQGDDDDNSQSNVFAAALSKARKGMDKKQANQPVVDSRKESDIQWEKAMESLNRPLIINDLDFTELEELDDSDPLRQPLKMANGRGAIGDGPGSVPPPPPLGTVPPPPPFGGVPPPPPGGIPRPPGSPQLVRQDTDQGKDMRTVKLFWKEAQLQAPQSVMETRGVFWQKMKPVEIDSEKLVHLFETKTTKEVVAKKKEEKKPEIRVLDTKRSMAINVGLTKLPPPRAIKTAIMKYDSAIMNKEGIEKILSTMMPTEEEKERMAEAQATNPEVPLGTAEQFLLLLSEIPALLPRLRLWLFMLDYANLEKEVAEPLMDLKLAMEELDQSRTFQYVMATLLAVGNVLNGAEIKGFQLDFLAKVPEVKDTVNKHSLVHHLCTMVQEKFPDSTDLYSELGAVVRCAKVDFDEVMTDLERMEKECKASWDYLRVLAKHESSHNLKTKIGEFLSDCAQRIMTLKIIHRRVINRFRKFLLYMGIPQHSVKDTKINSTCKTIAEFALDYRTCCDKINQQKKRLLDKRERNKTRGKMITDNVRDIAQNGSALKSPTGVGRRDEARHDELSKVLQSNQDETDGANSWKNYPGARLRQRPRNISPNPPQGSGAAAVDGQESPDDEILDGLVKAATVKTDHPREQRRKARQFNRKSLRRTRTLKLVQDQVGE